MEASATIPLSTSIPSLLVREIASIHRQCSQSDPALPERLQEAIEEHKYHTKWATALFSSPHEVPYGTIMYIVERFPDALVTKSLLGERMPLHYACLRGYSTRSLTTLVRCRPACLYEEDRKGCHPMNYLSRENARAGMLSSIHSVDHAVFRTKNGNGELPIHTACREKWDIEALKVLITDFSDGACATSDAGDTPLFEALKGHRDPSFEERITLLLRVCPRSAKIRNKLTGKYPLHYALDLGVDSFSLIHELVEAYPSALRKYDRSGRRPYDVVVREKLSDKVLMLLVLRYVNALKINNLKIIFSALVATVPTNVVQNLLRCFPEYARERGFGGKLPLHFLLASWSTFKDIYGMELLETMVELHPGALLQMDERRCSPLSYACSQNATKDVFRLLFRHPGIALLPDVSNMLPLHHLLSSSQRATEDDTLYIAGRLLAAYPQAIMHRDSMGRLPLHYACTSAAPAKVIRFILAKNPVASSVLDSCGMPALFYLVEHFSNYSVAAFVRLMEFAKERSAKSRILRPHDFIRLCEQSHASYAFCLAWCDLDPVAYSVSSSRVSSRDTCASSVLKTWSDDTQCLEIVKKLFKSDTGAVTALDNEGYLPLDLAILRYCASRLEDASDDKSDDESIDTFDDEESVSSISESFSDGDYTATTGGVSCHEADDSSLSTMHVISPQAATFPIIDRRWQDMYTAAPLDPELNLRMIKCIGERMILLGQVRASRRYANPLLFALSLPGCSMELVHALVHLFPSSIAEKDAGRRTLLHIASRTVEQRAGLIHNIFGDFTDEINPYDLDITGNVALFYAAENPETSLDTVFFLLKRHLDLFHLAAVDGSSKREAWAARITERRNISNC
jgi:ankyrin repeat protein